MPATPRRAAEKPRFPRPAGELVVQGSRMNAQLGSILTLLGLTASIAIRTPYARRSSRLPVVKTRKGRLEVALLLLVAVGMVIIPCLTACTGILRFADYRLHPLALVVGIGLIALSLWLFWRSHDDLGANWSSSLEIRETHTLVDRGVYERIRHPMYTAAFLFTIAQTLLIANWIAGPAGLLAFLTLYLLRVRREERMMEERFGEDYRVYMRRTKRLIPGVL